MSAPRTLSTAGVRRQTILEAAERRFAVRGLHGTPTMEIAKARRRSGCHAVDGAVLRDAAVRRFFAHGMLLNVLTAMSAGEVDARWAELLLTPPGDEEP